MQMHSRQNEAERTMNIRDGVLMHGIQQRIIIINCCSSIIQTLKMPHCPTRSITACHSSVHWQCIVILRYSAP